MMLQTTPQTLKKSWNNKRNAMNYQTLIVRIVSVCVEKQCVVKTRDTIGKREKSLHSLRSIEGTPNAPYPSSTDSPTPKIFNNYSMSPRWISSDKITNERVARVGYNHFISNEDEWNNCFSKFSNRVLPPIFISTILQSENF